MQGKIVGIAARSDHPSCHKINDEKRIQNSISKIDHINKEEQNNQRIQRSSWTKPEQPQLVGKEQHEYNESIINIDTFPQHFTPYTLPR